MRRRNFLRGVGGATLALPLLEYFAPTGRARAAGGAPMRFVYMFAGVSTGRSVNGGPDPSADWITPTQVGTDYDLRESMQPIVDFGVQAHTSIVSGLTLPWGDADIPPGGRHIEFHSHSTCPLICGVRSKGSTDESASGPSVDQVVADQIAGDTLHHALAFRVQAANYRGSNGDGGNRGRISYRLDDQGNIEKIDPIISPRLAFQSLFGNFEPTDPEAAAAAAFAFETRRSVLDVVSEDTQSLLPRLGAVDRQRIERHFDEIRALENRLDAAPPEIGGACQLPADPGADPPIGAANVNQNDGGYSTTAGYSDEQTRAEVLLELTRMAFACDLSRVASVMLTMAQCFLNMHPLFGYAIDFHNSGHGNANNALWHADAVGWHVQHFARFLAGLRDTPDVDGRTLLDNTAAVLMFEGGHGYDPATGNDGSPHSTENMSVLVGGHAGGLSPNGGRHVRGNGRHPVEVVNTAMSAVGVDGGLGEVQGQFDALFG